MFARAPYNFIPLPEKVVTVDDVQKQDIYEELTGRIECQFESKSPIYIGGMLTADQYQQMMKEKGLDLSDSEKERQKIEQSHFFNIDRQPIIPGSSLRGMIRTLVEIAGYGKIQWVGREPAFTFRSMADQSDDPLHNQYIKFVGNNAKFVHCGYLVKDEEDWFIQPALSTKAAGCTSKENPFLKIDDEDISPIDLPGFIPMNQKDYVPQIHKVSFIKGDLKLKRKPENSK